MADIAGSSCHILQGKHPFYVGHTLTCKTIGCAQWPKAVLSDVSSLRDTHLRSLKVMLLAAGQDSFRCSLHNSTGHPLPWKADSFAEQHAIPSWDIDSMYCLQGVKILSGASHPILAISRTASCLTRTSMAQARPNQYDLLQRHSKACTTLYPRLYIFNTEATPCHQYHKQGNTECEAIKQDVVSKATLCSKQESKRKGHWRSSKVASQSEGEAGSQS